MKISLLRGIATALVAAGVTCSASFAQEVVSVSDSSSNVQTVSTVLGDGGCSDCNGCDSGCNSCCDDGCGLGSLFDCCLGEPFVLFGEHCSGLKVGGWLQAGYHDGNTGLFNNHEDRLNVHQAWLYAERVADGSCGLDWGFRVDTVYGVDAQDTQAFGNNPGVYDFQNGLDHGIYGWAFPQAYVELASGDLSVKVGHFFTIVGYEVVTAPDNFFYSHAFTMNNSEPFTHTGALGTYQLNDSTELYGGWTLGWDTGFDQWGDGSNFLGGFKTQLVEDISMAYVTTIGDFGQRGDGYSHSLVFDVTLTENMNYVLQSDLVNTNAANNNDQVGVNQYLFYTVSDCLKVGGRLEWWKNDGVSNYAATGGVNIIPHANLIIRPEVRQQWVPNTGFDETILGVDAIVTF